MGAVRFGGVLVRLVLAGTCLPQRADLTLRNVRMARRYRRQVFMSVWHNSEGPCMEQTSNIELQIPEPQTKT